MQPHVATPTLEKIIFDQVATQPLTIQPVALQAIISGTVSQLLQEIEERQKAATARQAPTITSAAMAFLADRSGGGHCTDKTVRENLAIVKLVISIIGDKPVDSITHQDMQATRQTLLQLPPNITRSPRFRNLTIGQILQLKPACRMSLRSVNKYLARFSAFLNWCVRVGYIPANPFRGGQIRIKANAMGARKPFSVADLGLLFSPYNFKFRPSESWRGYIILLALTTGMRLEEICQLQCADIVNVDGITCIDINDNGDKKLKTQSSRRVIPIHPILLERFDFLGFVGHQTSFATRLFPALHKVDGSYGHGYSKWFARYRERCGVTGDGKCFHSFRHLVATTLKTADVPVYVAAEILGHAVPGMTYGHYGKESSVEKMAKALEHLRFDEILRPVFSR